MRLTTDHQDRLLAWARKKLGTDGWTPDAVAYGIIEDREGAKPLLRAIIVVNLAMSGSARVHVWSDGSRRWASADVLTRISAYLHYQRGINRLWMVVGAKNLPAIIAALKIGFQIDGRNRCGADDGSDGIVLSMLRDENPWLKDDDDG